MLLAASLAAPLAAQAQQQITFGISAKPGSLQHATAVEFTKQANERLQGRAVVKLFHSAQLGKDKELMQKLKLGTVQIALPSSIMSSISDEFGLFDMPFLVKDRQHVGRIEREIFWNRLAPSVQRKGYQVLAVWENGIRHITNNKRPINTPADLDGIKLRTPKSKWRVIMFKAWGANPTPMAFSEVFVALQTGVIDGQENPYTNIVSARFAEVQKYLSATGHVYSPAYPTMGRNTYLKLDESIRRDLQMAAWEMAAWARRKGASEDESLKQKLVDAGMRLNVAERAAFVAASQPIYDEFARSVTGGKALIERALALAK